MKLTINRIRLTNFKGTKSKEISFSGNNVRIIGCNGAGKTTIASSVCWLISDTDYNLVKNPNVVPLGMPECEIKVEVEFDLDGKPLELCKTQKYKEKTDDTGKVTSSVTNTYSINGVSKSYRDFCADLESRGIDVENFLIYTNPNSFLADTSKAGREKIRKILFEMATDISNEDIAKEIGAEEVVKAMAEKGYSLEEIKVSAKSTIKKITDDNGKQNEIINAKIDGMLSSKALVDIKALEVEKTAIQGEIDALQAQLDSEDKGKAEIEKRIKALKDDRAGIIEKANSDIKKKESELQLDLIHLETDKSVVNADHFIAVKAVNDADKEISSLEESLNNWRDLYKKVQDEVLDEKDFKCPTCGQALPDKEIVEIKENFESSKNERMNAYRSRGEDAKERIESLKVSKAESEKASAETHQKAVDIDIQIDAIRKQIEELPKAITSNEDTDRIDAEIKSLNEELIKDDSEKVKQLTVDYYDAKERLKDVIGKLAVGDRNAEIDRQVEALRAKRKADEVAKAQAEKILDEVDKIEMAKNEKLAESINAHFDLVEWHLWERQRNGSFIETTEPFVDGKPMSSCANGSLISLAKLSICDSLQKARNQRMPIWCDDASLFSKNSVERIKLDTQFIQLIVADNSEIIVEGE